MATVFRSRAILRAFLALVAVAALLAAGRPAAAGGVVYVVPGGAGARTGADWSNARSLGAALAAASSGDELWVKAGTYKPDTTGLTDPRAATFTLKSGVAVYGGFAGSESSRDGRNPAANVTILSGDLLGDDLPLYENMGDNAYHVVAAPTGLDASAVLDGFTVQDGNADGVPPTPPVPRGTLSPNEGGGMYIDNSSSPTVTNVVFKHNVTLTNGGGMLVRADSSPTLTNVTFVSNVAAWGGGLYNAANANTILTNGAFIGNTGTGYGGGAYNGPIASLTLTNVVFRGNLAYNNGGALYNDTGRAVLTNASINGNYADTSGGGLYSVNSSNLQTYSPLIRNSIVWGNAKGEMTNVGTFTPIVSDSIVKGGYSGTGNFDADPQFVTPVAPDPNKLPTTTGDLHLRAGSPAAGVGSNSVTDPPLPATDLDGKPRVMGGVVDLGAYEFPCPLTTPARLYVNAAVGGGTGDGQSWANAYSSLSAALSATRNCPNITEVWVAKGTYKPTSGTDRGATFYLRNNLAVYGGFTSGQSSLSARDPNPATNGAALSGDLLGNDGANFANNGDNSDHIVTAYGTDTTAVLDGFTISGGNATDLGGGGMRNDSGAATVANVIFSGNFASSQGGAFYSLGTPTLTNVTFRDNSSSNGGGAMFIGGDLTLTNVTFSGNTSGGSGGAVLGGFGSPTLTNVTFTGNSSSSDGGAMFNNGATPTLTNVAFINNAAPNGGGISNNTSTLTLVNVVFKGNSANGVSQYSGFGGGMYSNGGTASLTNVVFSGNLANNGGGGIANHGSSPTLTNVTMSGNKAAGSGGGMYNNTPDWTAGASSPVIRNSIFWGDVGGEIAGPGATVTYSLIEGGFTGTGNLNTDPKFVALITAAAPTTSGDLHLQQASQAVNKGNNTFVAGVSTDLDGGPRVAFGTVDMGAYETGDTTPPTVILNPSADNCALPGANGWCRGAQTAGFTASDSASGVATPCAGASCNFTRSTTTNGSAVTIASGQVCDGANNCAPGINAGPFKIDSVAPTLSPTVSPNPPIVGGAATASPNASDATSGVFSQSCDAVDTSSAGPKTLTCRATDNAGNTTSIVVSYTVVYKVAYVSPTVGPPSVNSLYAPTVGTTYTPVKWRLTNAAGAAVTTGAVAAVRYTSMTCGGPTPAYSDGYPMAGGFTSANPKYDTLQGLWVLNWQLPSAKGCYALFVKYGTGQVIPFLYRVY
ncbi:MAG: choice-of-anchor Q domain-containing protein [Anaerolineae bacterium]